MSNATASEQAATRKRLAEVGGAASHEARHVAAALLLGIPVVEASAVPRLKGGELHALGHVWVDAGEWTYNDVYNRALMTVVGGMGEKNWPPPHPQHPSMQGKMPADPANDGARLWKAIKDLGLDELGYEVLVEEARILSKRRDFRRLEAGISHLLEQGHELGPGELEQVQAITRRETKTVPASARADDAGRFTALADVRDPSRRDTDRVAKGAFDQTIKRWQASGERIPLHWEETKSFRYRIGSVDPATLRDEGWVGLLLEGHINLEGEHRTEADHAWTAVKSNGVAVRLDYMLLANDEDNGVRTLGEVDVMGLTLSPTSEGRAEIQRKRATDLRELRRESDRLQVETALGCSLDEFRARNAGDLEPESEGIPSEDELRRNAAELGLRVPPRRNRAKAHLPIDADPAEIKAEFEALMTAQLRGVR